jgi:hypothetical protein
MRWSVVIRSGLVSTAMQKGCGGGPPHLNSTSMSTEGAPALTAAPRACLSTLMGFLRDLAQFFLLRSLALAGGDRREARSCPTPAPRCPSCPWRNCDSSIPRVPRRSRSFSGCRVPHRPWALPLTMSRCWRGCVRKGVDVCTGAVSSPSAWNKKGSSSGVVVALNPQASCL